LLRQVSPILPAARKKVSQILEFFAGLARAISECLSKEQYRKNAEDISRVLRSKDGVEMAIAAIERTA